MEAGREGACSERVLGHLCINYFSVLNYVGYWVSGPTAQAEVPHSEPEASKREALVINFVNIFLAHKWMLLGKTLINCITLVGKITCKLDN